MLSPVLQFSSGLLESVGQMAVVAGTALLLLMVVALGAFAYKSLAGDGVRWPDEREEPDAESEGVVQGNRDDDWKYY